jgi:hypothetical protein
MKKVFMLSVAGLYNEEEDRTPQFPLGIVYTQQGQLFAVLALMEKHDGIEKLIETLQGNNSIACKAANAAIRKLELPKIHFENGKTVNYSRLGTELRKHGRVQLYKTVEYEDDSTGDERAYIVWTMGVNQWPNVFEDEDVVDPDAWWNKKERFTE